MPDLPAVTREEFEKITCNRCGDCCERFYLRDDCFDEGRTWIDGDKTAQWLKEVIPIGPPIEYEDGWKGRAYRCPRFIRDGETGEGICTDYANRPHICANFPYGRPQDANWIPRCSWAVRIIDPAEIEH